METFKMLNLLTDEPALRILTASFKNPKTTQELSEQLDIPLPVCYKKIKKLVSAGLIKCVDTKHSNKGKSVRCYQSQVKSAYLFIDRGKVRIRLELTKFKDWIYDKTWNILEKNESENKQELPTMNHSLEL